MEDKMKAGVIGRFRPLHNGAARMLETLCSIYSELLIGIGSANIYNHRNPFTAEETEEILHLYLGPRQPNYKIVKLIDTGHIPEYSDGQMWRKQVITHFSKIDLLVTSNPYVEKLLNQDYKIVHPATLIPKDQQIPIKGSMVRMAMALGEEYTDLMPPEVAVYYQKKGLVERFRREFGLLTLTALDGGEWVQKETIEKEKTYINS